MEDRFLKFMREEAERGKKNPTPFRAPQKDVWPAYQPTYYLRPQLPTARRFDGDGMDGRSGFHDKILRYVEAQEEQGLDPYVNASIIIDGNDRVGNKTFRRRYEGVEYVSSRTYPNSKTCGIQEAMDKHHAQGKLSRIFIKDKGTLGAPAVYSMGAKLTLGLYTWIEGETQSGTYLQAKAGLNDHMIIWAASALGTGLLNMILDGNYTNVTSGDILHNTTTHNFSPVGPGPSIYLQNLNCIGGYGWAFYNQPAGATGVTKIIECNFIGYNSGGMINNASDGEIIGSQLYPSAGAALYINSGVGSFRVVDGYFGGGTGTSNAQVQFDGAPKTYMINCVNDNSYGYAWVFSNNCDYISIVGGSTSNPGNHADNTYSSFNIDSTPAATLRVIVSGMTFWSSIANHPKALLFAQTTNANIRFSGCLIDPASFHTSIMPPTNALGKGYYKFENCQGLNPYNLITSPFNVTTLNSLGNPGGVATPAASTVYTVSGVDIRLLSAANSANANNAIVIKDTAGNTVWSPGGTIAAPGIDLPVGFTVNWGAFTGAAGAVVVYGL